MTPPSKHEHMDILLDSAQHFKKTAGFLYSILNKYIEEKNKVFKKEKINIERLTKVSSWNSAVINLRTKA